MEMIKLYQSYIDEIDTIDLNDHYNVRKLIEEITYVILDETEVKELSLDIYNSNDVSSINSRPFASDSEYKWDLSKIKAKLRLDLVYLKESYDDKMYNREIARQKMLCEKEHRELSRLELQLQLSRQENGVNILTNNYNQVEANAISKSYLCIENVIDKIELLKDDTLPTADKEELIEKIKTLSNSQDNKQEMWDQLKQIIIIAVKNGPIVYTAIWPYIQMMLNN